MSGSRAISSEDSIENNKGKRMVNSDDEDEAKYPPDHLLPIKKRRYSPTSHPHQSTSEPNPSNCTEVKNEEITEDEAASTSGSTPDEEEPNNYAAEVNNLEENYVPRKNRSGIPKRARNMDYGMKVLVDKVLTSSYKTYSPFHLPRKPAEELFPNLQTKREQMVEFTDLIAERKREMKVVYYEGFGTGYQVQRGWNEFMTEHRLEIGDRVRLYKREMYWDVLPSYFIDYVKANIDSGVSPSQSSSAGGRKK